MAKTRKFHYAFIILIGVAIIRGFSGPAINASSGLFMKTVADDIGVGIGQLSIYLSISSIATIICLPICGTLLNKYSARTVAAAGVIMQTAAFALMGTANSVWVYYVLAVPKAIGAAILVNLLGPVLLNRWFLSNKGLVMGILMTITSLMGAVFQPLLTNLIAGIGWRQTYIRFGIIALVVMLAAVILLLRNSPKEKGMEAFGFDKQDESKKGHVTEGVTQKRAVKSLAFYMLVLFMIVLTGFASFSQHITTYGLELGFTIETVGKALAISMIGSAIGSILMGILSDKIGVITTSLGVLGIGAIATGIFLFGSGGFGMFATATFLHGLATSAVGVIAPILTATFFGYKDYEKLFSLVMTGSPLASIVLLPAYGFIYDKFGNYQYVFYFLFGALIVGAIALVIGKNNSKKLV